MIRRKLSVLLMVGAVLALGACSDDDDDQGPTVERFTANLTGGAETPSPVTTSATGSAVVTFTASGPIEWIVNVAGIQNVTLAHIHGPGAPGVSAGVVLGLNPQLNPPVTTGVLTAGSASTTGSATVSLDSLKVLIRNGNAYVNVHNQANPGGHIRGQLVPG
jgi:hypothetical protein